MIAEHLDAVLITFMYSCSRVTGQLKCAIRHRRIHKPLVGLRCSAFDPQRTRTLRQLVMALETTQSGVLQQLGVSYPQMIDYSSKQYTATLVGRTAGLHADHSNTQTDTT